MDILNRIVDDSIDVLLDVGALLIKFSNEQVATEWLKLKPNTIEPAVFFDANNNLVVMEKNSKTTTLFNSQFISKNLPDMIAILGELI